MIKNIKKNLKEIEKELNTHEEWEQEVWTYKLSRKDNIIVCKILDDENVECIIQIESDDYEDSADIITGLINYLYENEINYRQSFIKGTDAYNRRKIKSMANWSSKGNDEKVNKIQEELICRFKATNNEKAEVQIYKEFVRDFYRCLNNICPHYRTKEIKDTICNRIEDMKIEGVVVTDDKDTITITAPNYNFGFIVDSYSNKNMIVTEVMKRLQRNEVF